VQTYLDHFNAKRYDEQIKYYAPDVAFDVGTLKIRKPEDIKTFYADFHQYVDEHVEILDYIQSGNQIAMSLPSVFKPFRDYEKHGLSFLKGKIYENVSFIIYDLENDKFKRIRMARHSSNVRDA
jgi:hypothetical protein